MSNINWKKDAVAAIGKCLVKAIYLEYKQHREDFSRDDAVGVFMTHFSWMKTYLERTQNIKIPNWYNAVKQRISRGTEHKYHDEWPEINQFTKPYWQTALNLAKRTYFQRTVNEAYVSSAARGAAMEAGINPDTNKPLDVEPKILTKKKAIAPVKSNARSNADVLELLKNVTADVQKDRPDLKVSFTITQKLFSTDD